MGNITLNAAERKILNAIVDGENIEEIKTFLDIAEKLIKPQLEKLIAEERINAKATQDV